MKQAAQHAVIVPAPGLRRKQTSFRRGMVLVEATIALSIISVIGIVLLKLSMNILHPRMSIIQETLADSYMSYERALAERIPFDELKGVSSEWPEFPDTSTVLVELGRMPGGNPISGTIIRTRIPDENNLPVAGGTGTDENNPAALEIWQVQSVLRYQISGREYAKSRTVIRSQ